MGVVLRGALEEIDAADQQWCFGISVFGVVLGVHALLPAMIARKRGNRKGNRYAIASEPSALSMLPSPG